MTTPKPTAEDLWPDNGKPPASLADAEAENRYLRRQLEQARRDFAQADDWQHAVEALVSQYHDIRDGGTVEWLEKRLGKAERWRRERDRARKCLDTVRACFFDAASDAARLRRENARLTQPQEARDGDLGAGDGAGEGRAQQ